MTEKLITYCLTCNLDFCTCGLSENTVSPFPPLKHNFYLTLPGRLLDLNAEFSNHSMYMYSYLTTYLLLAYSTACLKSGEQQKK